ncbi:SDR family NAD(P)-dependent oxidoreductase [Sandaracinus amylolyticus]|uniref:3-oxoacyl-[acyl-carrier protein] reductase n=1 Tax=Sandaracinus amylolyticus TaxID=927083 RepID=A0A0F6YP44_9BACT|nr:SDR family NAD(P)-dependent oxidoreductase [Sandaracinus amylolyticus]AKF11082.1 3-oxoacyl-[acyl-carrier protein] reductase [Sandaracinus amylolyticus]
MAGSSRRVLVTGASRGIGRATALALARRGDRLVLAARDEDALREVAREVLARGADAMVVRCDVTDDASVSSAIERALAAGPIDVLVNNAGVFHQAPFLAQDPTSQRREMDVNYFGALRVARAVLPSMIARRRGTIVNVSSIVGAIPCPTVASYCGSKAALNAWSHALRGEVAQHGVRIVVFLPSHTDTEHALATTRFDGVIALRADYVATELVRAIDRAPRAYAASPVFRAFLRLAGMFPAWAEARMRASTRSLLALPG